MLEFMDRRGRNIPILVLGTRLLRMPGHIMHYAVRHLALHTDELRHARPIVYLSALAFLRNAPSEARDGFYGGFGSELVVFDGELGVHQSLDVGVLQTLVALRAVDVIPYFGLERVINPFAETAEARVGCVVADCSRRTLREASEREVVCADDAVFAGRDSLLVFDSGADWRDR